MGAKRALYFISLLISAEIQNACGKWLYNFECWVNKIYLVILISAIYFNVS